MTNSLLSTMALIVFAADVPRYEAELIFPLHAQHNHAPSIVECPNGDLLVSWYRGSGERTADDVAVLGARRRKGDAAWSDAFLLADHPGFPDCNTAMFIDGQERLWLFWPVILANSWESCLTNGLVSKDYQADGPPKWDWHTTLYLKPKDFEEEMIRGLNHRLESLGGASANAENLENIKKLIAGKLDQRLGWQPRCKPTVLPSGRIVLPLYSDTFSVSIMAISDDSGKTWFAGRPLAGYGNIQPTVLRRKDGNLIAYMRENGPLDRIRIAESSDEGLTWGPVDTIALPNPGSGLDGVVLASGAWALVYNDLTRGRNSLAISLSEDEGRTWTWTRHFERHDSGEYHYPAIIQGQNQLIHVVYSYFVEGGKSMKHVTLNEAWVKESDQ